MRIKKLFAVALASTMVFSMAACSGNKDEKSGSGSSEVTAKSVIEAFGEFKASEDVYHSYDMIMDMKLEAGGMEVTMSSKEAIKEGKNIKYSKSESSTNLLGQEDKSVTETYTITKEDGVVIEASKDAEDDEWDVTPILNADEEKDEFDVAELEKTAKIENDGDMYYVTATITAEQMGLAEEDSMMAGLENTEIEIVITYNGKTEEIEEIDINMPNEIIAAVFSALLGEVEVKEFEMKMENIEKFDGNIEIPAEIEID